MSEPQLKKRRDTKKKKKDDVIIVEEKEGLYQEHAHSATKTTTNGDINIHVHKEPTTGGGVCAKLIFFVIFAILATIIALLINEHRENINGDIESSSLYLNSIKRSNADVADSAEHSEEQNYDDNEIEEQDYESNEHSSEIINEHNALTEENVSLSKENTDASEEEDETSSFNQPEVSDEIDENEDDQDQDENQSSVEAHTENSSQEDTPNDSVQETFEDISTEERAEIDLEGVAEDNDKYHMMIKLSVGTALVVVAYIVLVRKWKTEEKVIQQKSSVTEIKNQCISPNLSRRNTIVIPPSLCDVQYDIDNVEEDNPSEDIESDSDDSKSKSTKAEKRYMELQSTYSTTLTPDWEPQQLCDRLKENYEIEYESDGEEEEEDDTDTGEEVEAEDELDDNVDNQNDNSFDDEISEDEDAELLRRLEQKYGKLQQYNNEDDLDGLDEDENFHSWKRVQINQDESESDNEQGSAGPQALYEFSDITNSDDWIIREELDQANHTLQND